MQRYNITELSSKTLEELQEIAREIGFSPDAFPEKRELIYEILDQQAVTVAETTSVKRKPGRPRKSSSAEESTHETRKSTPAISSAPADDAPEASEDAPEVEQLISFFRQNADKQIEIILKGDKDYSYKISKSNVKTILDTYDFAKILKEVYGNQARKTEMTKVYKVLSLRLSKSEQPTNTKTLP